MIRSLMVLFCLLLFAIVPPHEIQAQTPGMFGLYVDEAHSSNEASAPGIFTGYLFCLPGDNGLMCAEFQVKLPEGAFIINSTAHPDVSVALGSLATGMSVCFSACRMDWVWTHSFSVYTSSAAASEITVERHPETGERQLANCFGGYPLEDVLVSSKICINKACPPDTDPPYPTGMTTADGLRFHLEFNEEMFRPDVQTEANYLAYPTGNPGSPIAVSLATIDVDGYAAADLRLASATAPNTVYTLVLNNLRDIAGNVIPAGTELLFVGLDNEPPDLVSVAASSDSTVIVKFSEIMNEISAEKVSGYTIVPGPSEGIFPVMSAELAAAGDTVLLRLGAMLEQETVYSLTVSGMTDIGGNPVDFAGPLQFAAFDITPPEVAGVEAIDQRSVRVLYDEEVTPESAGDASNYSIYRAAASESLLAIESAVPDSPLQTTLHLSDPLEFDAEYFINITGIENMGGLAIEPPGVTLPFILEDFSRPFLVSASALNNVTLELVFSEPMDTSTTGDETRYSVFRTGDESDTIHVVAAYPGEDGTSTTLSLGSAMPIGVYYTVRASGVADPAGNLITSQDNAQVIIPDIDPPQIVSLALRSMSSLDLCFNEALDPETASDEDNYEIARDGYPGESFVINGASPGSGGTCVLLSFTPPLVDDGEYTLLASRIADVAGNFIADGSSFVFTAEDVWPPLIAGVSATTPQSIRIDFNEALAAEPAGDAGNYTLRKRDDPASTIDVVSAVPDGAKVALALASAMENWVPYILTVTGIEDLAGNAIAEGTGVQVISIFGNPEAYITLFLDLYHTETSTKPGIYEFFDGYVWCLPSERGAICGEFALENGDETPDFSCLAVEQTLNPEIVSVSLGTPYEGMSVCFNHCINDWAWMVKIRYLYISGQGIIRVIPDPAVDDILTANCLEGYPMEVAMTGSPLLVHVEYIATLLSRFDAAFRDGAVEVSWALGEGSEIPAFAVSRTEPGGGIFEEIQDARIARDGVNFTFTDRDYLPGESYRYRVDYLDDGERRVLFETEPVETPALPLSLAQNRPNPFNPSTEISFNLPGGGRATIEIFDVNGRSVVVLCDRVFGQGSHTVVWDGRGPGGAAMSSGVYFYRLTAGKERISRKMVLLR